MRPLPPRGDLATAYSVKTKWGRRGGGGCEVLSVTLLLKLEKSKEATAAKVAALSSFKNAVAFTQVTKPLVNIECRNVPVAWSADLFAKNVLQR